MKCAQVISLTALLVLCTLQWSSAVPPPTPKDIALEFGIKMYQEICSKNTGKNVLFSPISISTAFGMLIPGADKKTKMQLIDVLKLNKDVDINNKEYKRIIEALAQKNPNYAIHLAHQFFGSTKFKYNETYQKKSETYFHSQLKTLDFSKTEESLKTINDWVSKQTDGKIEEFLLEESITPSTVLEIIDAFHVVAPWKYPFDVKDTKPGTFTTSTNEKITMDIMHLPALTLNYVDSKELNCEVVELPFLGDKLCMYVLLPHKDQKFVQVQKRMTPAALIKVRDSLKPHTVKVNLPKFTTDQRIPLMNHLKAMGMIDLFDAKNSDLSGIIKSKGVLYASETTHKTLWGIDENGLNSPKKPVGKLPPVGANPTVFDVNRPYMVLIKEKIANVPLLCGHVLTKPVTDEVLV